MVRMISGIRTPNQPACIFIPLMKHPTQSIPNKRQATLGGFTLTELLVVILIILVLGALAFLTVGTFLKKAWAAESSSNLRQLGTSIQSYVDEHGRYPESYDFIGTGGASGGGAWTWQIRDQIGFSSLAQWPFSPVLQSRHGKKGLDSVPSSARPDLQHYAASAIVLLDVDENSPNGGNSYIRPVNLNNPVRIILLGDAPLKTPGAPASGCHSAWWSLRFGAVQGNPEERVNETLLRNDIDFWNNGKALFLFVDCHVETLGPKEIRKWNFQL